MSMCPGSWGVWPPAEASGGGWGPLLKWLFPFQFPDIVEGGGPVPILPFTAGPAPILPFPAGPGPILPFPAGPVPILPFPAGPVPILPFPGGPVPLGSEPRPPEDEDAGGGGCCDCPLWTKSWFESLMSGVSENSMLNL